MIFINDGVLMMVDVSFQRGYTTLCILGIIVFSVTTEGRKNREFNILRPKISQRMGFSPPQMDIATAGEYLYRLTLIMFSLLYTDGMIIPFDSYVKNWDFGARWLKHRPDKKWRLRVAEIGPPNRSAGWNGKTGRAPRSRYCLRWSWQLW